jgi:steroid delta-isomerase-like uncharacterized protein
LHTLDASGSSYTTQARLAKGEEEYRISKKRKIIMSELNKNAVRRLVEEVWNKGNLSIAEEVIAPNCAHHDPSTPDLGQGPEGEKKRATLYRTAFPDIRLMIEDIIAEGETVMARWSCRGTHKGDLRGIAPTGKQITISGVSIARFANGKIVEGWVNWDTLGFMQQLGVVPELGKAKVAAAKP